MINKLLVILVTYFIFMASNVLACSMPPVEYYQNNHAELVKQSSAIVLVTVSKIDSKTCQFKIVETLKDGNTPLPDCILLNDNFVNDFNKHTEQSFWSGYGRLINEPSCDLETPLFKANSKYLLLINDRNDSKNFEEIHLPNDKWLQFVRSQIR